MKFKRTCTCGELTKKDIKKEICLMGWVNSSRDHGGIIFVDLRDRYGLTQVVFDPKHKSNIHKDAEQLRREDVIGVRGKVRARGKGLENLKLKTGQIEVLVDEIEILNKAETPPLEIDDRINMNEDVRLKYRYLDLRRPSMQHNILVRHKAVKLVRDYFDALGFLEIETPLLGKSTPEGARDYLVPSRVNPGKFYALPQSPQILKQICMISGFDRYFQIVKCFRDEDLRTDRQPEFTQIDVEMSFIDQEDIFSVIEDLLKGMWKKILNKDIKIPFKRVTYSDAMDKYGSDKPDLRFGLELIDVTDAVKKSNFEVFTKLIKENGKVKCINAKKCANFSRKDLDELIEFVRIYDAKGMAWMKVAEKGLESSIVKYFDQDIQKELIKATDAKKDDLLLFVADHKHHVVDVALGHLRNELARRLKLTDKKEDNFVWVTDFPLLEFDENEQRHVAVHHPFTSPKDEDLKLLDSDIEKVKAKAYDITLNGVEIGGGSIRIHNPELQKKIFRILGISDKQAMEKFGFLINAFKYGAPPHGGIALGMDRIVAMLTGNTSIREVIAFPKTKNAEDLMMESPGDVDEKQLKELNIKLDLVKKK
ncbi:MAG: aspartate--tRNA ligase [Candidatus Woesearchaeota archaeon]